jgi:lysophospholipase L1-like esterase
MASNDGNLAIQDGQTVVFIGDSITDCGRRATAAPLGNGYVSMAVALVAAKYPQRGITFINEGIGGDVSTGLRERWDDDLLVHKPDWVSVLIGINDLHRTLRQTPEAVPPDLYRQAYTQCLQRSVENTSAKLILMDPFYMSRAADPHSWRSRVLKLLPEYVAVVDDLAGKFGAVHVRLHEMFQRVLAHRPSDFVCPEPVHPNPAGHLMIAHEWLQAVNW